MSKGGLFVSFEGNEGAGKTTQSVLLAKKLREDGYTVLVVREPGSTHIGELVREVLLNPDNKEMTPLTEAFLLAGARSQAVEEMYRPALEMGSIILADRYVDSSYIYQGYGRQLGLSKIKELNDVATGKLMPNLTIWLDLDWHTGLVRRHKTDKIDRMDMQQNDFYERVDAGYKELAENNPDRIKRIDANLPIAEIQTQTLHYIESLLASRQNNIARTGQNDHE